MLKTNLIFSGLLKKIVGVAPSIYLENQLQIRSQIIKSPLAFVPGCYAYQHGWLENGHFEKITL